MSSRHLGQYKGNFYIMDEVLIVTGPKATITRSDLSPRFFCIDATLLCEFESDKI